MEAFSRIRTKSGKNKTYGLKWKSPKNIGTKSGFFPNLYATTRKSFRLCLVAVKYFLENKYFLEMLFFGKENIFKCLVAL